MSLAPPPFGATSSCRRRTPRWPAKGRTAVADMPPPEPEPEPRTAEERTIAALTAQLRAAGLEPCAPSPANAASSPAAAAPAAAPTVAEALELLQRRAAGAPPGAFCKKCHQAVQRAPAAAAAPAAPGPAELGWLLGGELQVSGGGGQRRRGGAAEGTSRGSRIRPNNFGYTTYIDRVFGLRCFEDLVCAARAHRGCCTFYRAMSNYICAIAGGRKLRVFPDAKDISESYCALQAVRLLLANAAPASAFRFLAVLCGSG